MIDDDCGNKECVVVVHSVAPDGPAAHAGVCAGDIVSRWNGVALEKKAKLQQMLARTAPGSSALEMCLIHSPSGLVYVEVTN